MRESYTALTKDEFNAVRLAFLKVKREDAMQAYLVSNKPLASEGALRFANNHMVFRAEGRYTHTHLSMFAFRACEASIRVMDGLIYHGDNKNIAARYVSMGLCYSDAQSELMTELANDTLDVKYAYE